MKTFELNARIIDKVLRGTLPRWAHLIIETTLETPFQKPVTVLMKRVFRFRMEIIHNRKGASVQAWFMGKPGKSGQLF